MSKRPPVYESPEEAIEEEMKKKPKATIKFLQVDVIPGDNGSVLYREMYDIDGDGVCLDIVPAFRERWYQVPTPDSKLPPYVIELTQPTSPLPTTIPEYDGFKDLEVFSTIWPTAHCKNMAYRYFRGVPEISNRRLFDTYKETPTAWQVSVFRGINPNNPEEDDGQRYIFTGCNAKNIGLLQKVFMRLDDLKKRIEKGNDQVILDDKKALYGDLQQLPYSLWDYNGKPIHGDDKVYLDILKMTGGRNGQDNNDTWIQGSFTWYCGLARQAQANPGLSYSVLSRFWDKKWPQQLDFLLVVDSFALHKLGIGKPNSRATQLEEDINNIVKGRKFQPKIHLVWDHKIDAGYAVWARHPNGLYTIYAHDGIITGLKGNKELGLWLNGATLPQEVTVTKVDLAMKGEKDNNRRGATYSTGKDAEKTYTSITINSMAIAKKMERNPTQNDAMGGISANKVARDFWQDPPNAEWLHRSAWSFGGLASALIRGPESSQQMSNLVFGTVEANTSMLRYEIFAKRLAQYAKSASNDTKVNVMTAIKAPGTVTTFTNGKYAWFAPKLLYQINSDANCDVKAEITYVFDTLERRIPTRLEIQLDELFENYCYGWSSTDQ